MAKRKIVKVNKNSLFMLLAIVAAALVLSVLLPAVLPNATGFVKTIVDFFVQIRNHFIEYWMVYTFALAIVLAYFAKKK